MVSSISLAAVLPVKVSQWEGGSMLQDLDNKMEAIFSPLYLTYLLLIQDNEMFVKLYRIQILGMFE